MEYQDHVLMVKDETRLHKYLDRVFDIVQCRYKPFKALSKYEIFTELNKVVECQLAVEINREAFQLENHIKDNNIIFQEND